MTNKEKLDKYYMLAVIVVLVFSWLISRGVAQ
jgi:hypothetical protein